MSLMEGRRPVEGMRNIVAIASGKGGVVKQRDVLTTFQKSKGTFLQLFLQSS